MGRKFHDFVQYYHLRSTMKREHIFAKVYFSNVDGLDSNLSRLTNETFDHKLDRYETKPLAGPL